MAPRSGLVPGSSSSDPRVRQQTAVVSGTEAAARVTDVLLMFTDGPASLGVTEIARELGLSKAVVHRILQSLADRSFVAADPVPHEYRLGQGAVALGTRVLRNLDLRRAARLVLRQLRDTTGETTTVSEVTNLSRVYLDQFESPQEIKMTVELGRRHPLHAGASGRAIRAFLPPDTIEQVIGSGLPTLTPETTRSAGRLMAAPAFGMEGEIAGAISVCGPISRFDAAAVARYAPLVTAAAQDVSWALGWAGDGLGTQVSRGKGARH